MMSEQTPVVIISGAASGMGRATARLLADAGYTVEGCDAVATDSVAQLDVRDDEAVRRWVDAVVARHGSIDAVVTFAGRALVGAFEETLPDEAADLLDVNLLGVSGAELPQVSAHDLARYEDTGVNWRVTDGLGALVSSYLPDVPATLGCPVHRIDRSGLRLRIETAIGAITADQVIVAAPTSTLADEAFFVPAIPEKIEASLALPLGLDDKLFLSLDRAEEFEKDSRLFGHTDRAGTGAYHLRPFGRPQIEAYFGGTLARELEAEGEAAFFDFAAGELTALLGSAFAKRIKPLRTHCWGADPFARGAYSFARPGKADQRAALAAPVENRLFFAGEACSRNDFSTVHGAFLTGAAAADQVLAVRRKGMPRAS